MASIGNFTRKGDGFEGQVKTLQFRETVRFVPADGSSNSEDAPDYIAFSIRPEGVKSVSGVSGGFVRLSDGDDLSRFALLFGISPQALPAWGP